MDKNICIIHYDAEEGNTYRILCECMTPSHAIDFYINKKTDAVEICYHLDDHCGLSFWDRVKNAWAHLRGKNRKSYGEMVISMDNFKKLLALASIQNNEYPL